MHKLTKETMRYKIPTVTNRFVPVHGVFLAVGFFVLTSAILLSLVVVRYNNSHVYQRKQVLFVCCAMQSPEEVKSFRSAQESEYRVRYLRYDKAFAVDEAKGNRSEAVFGDERFAYDEYEEALKHWDGSIEDCVYLVFRSDGRVLYEWVTYADLGLTDADALTAEELADAIKSSANR